MYVISKRFGFEASHQLQGLPAGHKCARLHGHSYVVEVVLAAERLDGAGFVLDYGNLRPIKVFLDDRLDHRHLNDLLGDYGNPSAELLARWLYEQCRDTLRIPCLEAVRVSETANTWAEYRP